MEEKNNNLKLQSNDLIERENTLKEKSIKLNELSAIIEDKEQRLNLQRKEIQEKIDIQQGQIDYLELSVKPIGYYVRGLQKKMDKMNIKIDILKTLQEIL